MRMLQHLLLLRPIHNRHPQCIQQKGKDDEQYKENQHLAPEAHLGGGGRWWWSIGFGHVVKDER